MISYFDTKTEDSLIFIDILLIKIKHEGNDVEMQESFHNDKYVEDSLSLSLFKKFSSHWWINYLLTNISQIVIRQF